MESEFVARDNVYKATKTISRGKVSTYKLIAHSINKSSGASQAIGRILGANTHSDMPCHRVVTSGGQISGYFDLTTDGAIKKRIRKLESE